MWLGTLVPLVVDMVNGRFTFETLTAPTANRIHFPAYDKFLKEIQGYIQCLMLVITPFYHTLNNNEYTRGLYVGLSEEKRLLSSRA